MNLKYFCVTGLAMLCAFASGQAQDITIKNNDKHIRYVGRVAVSDTATMLSWTATIAKINFEGTGVKATLRDERGENSYNVIVDGEVVNVIHPDKSKKEYLLASNLKKGKHTLELFKRTEWDKGKTWLYGFGLNTGDKLLAAPAAKKRKIEFFGNSITCGFGVEDTTKLDRGTAEFENGYITYAAQTARYFDADYHCTAKSGIGIVISWFPLLMPEMYDRLDATDPNSKWDFSLFTPDVVVVNLFQNDSWLTKNPAHEQFKARFDTTPPTPAYIINAYREFIKTVRSKYPKAQIICALGSMDATKEGSEWPEYIETAVAPLKDSKLHTIFFPFKGTPGHPSKAEQTAMAVQLEQFIEKNIKW